MSGGNSRDQVWDVYAKAIQTFDQKNADYGDAWRTNGWRGNLSRIFEKVQRVRNLAWRPDPRVPAVGDEQVLETLQDLLNTTAFAIINMVEEVEYGHEVPRSRRFSELEKQYEPGVAEAFYERVGTQLPHGTEADVAHLTHGHDEPVRTAVIPREELSAALMHGTDEMRPAEAEGTGRVPRKPRQKVVTDNPQA